MKSRANWMLAAILMTAPGWATVRVAAQGQPRTAAPAPITSDQNAERTREELKSIFESFPPELRSVLRLDPSLASNQGYLVPYPRLSAFLGQHPEIARNPAYFFGTTSTSYDSYSRQSASSRLMEEILAGAAVITGFTIALLSLGWFVRTMIDYRRWNRLSRVQTEAHNKLLDRFSANAELISYIQSPAGSQFLQSAPIALDPGARRLAAPISRIFWSLQAGLVLITGGLGLRFVSNRITDVDAQQACYGIGTMAIALGGGFVVSAAVAYFLSRRLGLFETQLTTHNSQPTTSDLSRPRGN